MTNNPFSNLISKELKQLYSNAIDSLIQQGGLSVPCRIKYSGQQNQTLCSNCIFDPIAKLSSNIYNNTGPNIFNNGTMCPVCGGLGVLSSDSSEIIYMAVIFDSKYWLNWSSKTVKIPDGMVQTICLSSFLPKIRNAKEVVFDTNLEMYSNYTYERAGDPNPVGFGDTRYIVTMWSRK
jgi:hypothetical protein